MPNKITLGSVVRDKITGFEGTAVARVEFLTRCARYEVQPKLDKDGKNVEPLYFDETMLEIIEDAAIQVAKPTTGGMAG